MKRKAAIKTGKMHPRKSKFIITTRSDIHPLPTLSCPWLRCRKRPETDPLPTRARSVLREKILTRLDPATEPQSKQPYGQQVANDEAQIKGAKSRVSIGNHCILLNGERRQKKKTLPQGRISRCFIEVSVAPRANSDHNPLLSDAIQVLMPPNVDRIA